MIAEAINKLKGKIMNNDVAMPNLFAGYDQREAVRSAIEENYPLYSHSGGCGCGGWDLGFFLVDQPESDPRSLELTGNELGCVKARVVENYRREDLDEPRREIVFGYELSDADLILPPSTIRAIEHMVNQQ